ncbi:MAG: hypothetical protein ABI681_07925 [Gemmatimonadales bacterium]
MQDKIGMQGDNTILFNTRTNDDIDGFDFKVDDVRVLKITLQVDGRPMPAIVRVGKDSQHPGALPLVITLR